MWTKIENNPDMRKTLILLVDNAPIVNKFNGKVFATHSMIIAQQYAAKLNAVIATRETSVIAPLCEYH